MLPDIFSRRKRQASKVGPDVFQYTFMSPQLRQQALFVLAKISEASGSGGYNAIDPYEVVTKEIREELGLIYLSNARYDYKSEFDHWFRSEKRVENLLDAIELMCRLCKRIAKSRGFEERTDLQISRLNGRFLEAEFGFQIEGPYVVQISDQYAHREIVVPALTLLEEKRFSTANQEYRKAHREFRDGQYADAVTDCGKSLESVRKVIAHERMWHGCKDDSNLAILIAAAVQNGLFPEYMESQITGLRALLQGIGTIRNKDGAHGKGERQSLDDRHLAAYQLHQTAAAIIFLAQR